MLSSKAVDLQPSFANILKCLSCWDIIFLVSQTFYGRCCSCLPCNQRSKWTLVVEEILTSLIGCVHRTAGSFLYLNYADPLYCVRFLTDSLRKAAKKIRFFSGPTTKRGEGVRAWPLRKRPFFEALKKKLWNIFCGH